MWLDALALLLAFALFVLGREWRRSPALRVGLRYLRTLLSHKAVVVSVGLWANRKLATTTEAASGHSNPDSNADGDECRLRVSWSRLLCHDWVKFLPAEFWPYAEWFCGPTEPAAFGAFAQRTAAEKAFQVALAHHRCRMDHHPEYWGQANRARWSGVYQRRRDNGGPLRNDNAGDDGVPGEAPPEAVVEIAVDLLAAAAAYDGKYPVPGEWAWVHRNYASFPLHPRSHALLGTVLRRLGFGADVDAAEKKNAARATP